MGGIGLQLFSVRDLARDDFFGTLGKVAEIGYGGVEFAGYFDVPPKAMKRRLDNLGLACAGCHVVMEKLESALDKSIAYAAEIGSPSIICPYLQEPMRDSAEAWKRTAERFDAIGRKCRESGVGFGYHNHDYAFEQFGGEYGLDILMRHTDPDAVFLELDTFWAEYAGVDATGIILKYGGRCRALHMKDMKSAEEKVCTEVGRGVMDIGGIARAGLAAGVEWFVMEQEDFEQPVLRSVAEDYAALERILSGLRASAQASV